jgi:hypothetical protein
MRLFSRENSYTGYQTTSSILLASKRQSQVIFSMISSYSFGLANKRNITMSLLAREIVTNLRDKKLYATG